MFLQSKPLAASLWMDSTDKLKEVLSHFPDPAFTESENWPDYSTTPDELVIREHREQIHSVDNNDIDFLKNEEFAVTSDTENEALQNIHQDVGHVQANDNAISPETEQTSEISPQEMKHSKKIARIAKKASQEVEEHKKKKPAKVKAKSASQPADFYSWLRSLTEETPNEGAKAKKPEKVKKPAKSPKESKPKSDAELSLKLGEEIVSETLARLLARQGHKEEAIEMYEKLIRKFPQKGSTFAAAIEKLKS